MDSFLTWLIRFVHVLSAACWVGGYALLALVIVPRLCGQFHEMSQRLALAACRLLTYAGVLTILSGAALVARTRGYGNLLGGEWGGIVIASFVLAVALLGIGDARLRPALRRLGDDAAGGATTQRWAVVGMLLGVLAIAFMTRALYARS